MAAIVVLLCGSVPGSAQFTTLGAGGIGGSGGAPSVCGAGQFDFSDGCNLIYFTGAMTP